MMDEWITTKKLEHMNFGLFYKNRYVLEQRVTPKEYDW